MNSSVITRAAGVICCWCCSLVMQSGTIRGGSIVFWKLKKIRGSKNWMIGFSNHQCSRALRRESGGSCPMPLEIRSWFKNKTKTVISSWKWRRTFLSIFWRSEYRISRFLAASWRAALTSLLALPYINRIWWAQDGPRMHITTSNSEIYIYIYIGIYK